MMIVAALLGPFLVLSGLAGYGAVRLLEALRAETGATVVMPFFPDLFEFAMAFAHRSTLITVPIGGVVAVAGIGGLGNLARGRRWLLIAGWITTVAMIALGVLWSYAAAQHRLPTGVHVLGAGLHLLQAGIVVRACLFLAGADVKAACGGASSCRDGSPPH